MRTRGDSRLGNSPSLAIVWLRMNAHDPLAAATFDSLDAMMEAYAEQAVRAARKDHGRKLDYSDASIEVLEELLASLDAFPPEQLEFVTRLWGSYFGEVLRRRYHAGWTMSVYPGGDLAVPTLEVRGSKIYPLSKIYRRLTLGASESLTGFYAMALRRLGDPAPFA
jgi:hypothetical protein